MHSHKPRHALVLLMAALTALTALMVLGAQNAAAQPAAPAPVSPADGATVTIPAFSWQAAPGAARYQVEVGPLSDPNAVTWSAQTVNRVLIPVDAAKFVNGAYYWRVRARDASGAAGPWSKKVKFALSIPAPSPAGPYASSTGQTNTPAPTPGGAFDGFTEQPISGPLTLQWRPAAGRATSYKVEVSASSTFVPLEATYTTYNEQVTPVSTLPFGTHYWRVSGVNADGHAGAPSSSWKFTTGAAGPRVVGPAAEPKPCVPKFEWAAVNGAAYFKVEMSDSPSFVPVLATWTTYNLGITPAQYVQAGEHYWRVSGVDAGGHVGTGTALHFMLWACAPINPNPTLQLTAPADAAIITTGPTFRWTHVFPARYRLIVSRYADFHATYDSVDTAYPSYTPYNAGSQDVYPDGVYYWRVETRDAYNKVVATSAARSFTKKQPLPLSAPAGAAVLTADPTFAWGQVVGAQRYRLIVSKYSDFHAVYDSIETEYNAYTPYTPGSQDAYANGVYYWKVEALDAGNVVIATSPARKFTKAQLLLLSDPADGAKGSTDPTFGWQQVAGAQRYRLLVSKYADFHAIFDSVTCDYNRYAPYTAGSVDTYPKGVYYWKVEARDSGDAVITTSKVWRFIIG